MAHPTRRHPTAATIAVTVAALAAGLLGGCGSDATPRRTDGGPGRVTIADYSFTPSTLVVSAGATVTWTNTDEFAHAVRDPATGQTGRHDIASGGTYTHTYRTAGTFPYVCAIHPNMAGTVRVR